MKFPMTDEQFHLLLNDESALAELLLDYPFYPLTSPGMPMAGPDFAQVAGCMGDVPGGEPTGTAPGHFLTYLYLRALYDKSFAMNVDVGGAVKTVNFVNGQFWGNRDEHGPSSYSDNHPKVMLIGKFPGLEEISQKQCFVGPSSRYMMEALKNVGVSMEDVGNWYVTFLVRYNPSRISSTLAARWIKNCEILLHQELRLLQPDYIICLGSEASKYLLGKRCGVEAMKGRVVEYRFPVHLEGEDPKHHTAQVMTALHPAAVYRSPERYDELESAVRNFCDLTHGNYTGGIEGDIDHRIVYDDSILAQIVDEILAAPGIKQLAVDAEWHGAHPWEPGSYLRSVQFSHRPKFAVCVALHSQGGGLYEEQDISDTSVHLRRLFLDPDVRIGGHFFRSDIPWIQHKLGIDLREKYAEGFDTSLMCHSVYETARFKLEEQAVRHTGCPRYDVDLQRWKESYCSEHGLKDNELEGYGDCPDDVLFPYGAYDADVTLRLHHVYQLMLQDDQFGNQCTEPYRISHGASLAFLEMEQSGLLVDKERVENLMRLFNEARARLIEKLRMDINWPDFNPGSPVQCRALLFGDAHGLRKSGDTFVPVRPEGAVTLNLEPVTSTGARPQNWSDLVLQGKEDQHTPATSRETLGILGQLSPVVAALRDIRFTEQVLKTTLRRPKANADGTPMLDENGDPVYDRGLLSHISSDGRIHTHLMQILETGRASSSRPNLQNISKRREDDYKRIIGERYEYPIRSIFRAAPGHVLVEADYTAAELAGIMWMAQDSTGIEHVRRNMLPESHPDHFDIHSQAAVRAFKLLCEPTKRGLKDAGKPGLRVAAKNVNFGIPYGRGAKAIARQCEEEGVPLTTSEAADLIDNYFDTYQAVYDFLDNCKNRVLEPGWIVNAFGRFRRFAGSSGQVFSVSQPISGRGYSRSRRELAKDILGPSLGEMERQAQNFPIQSLVADAMSLALHNLYQYRDDHDIEYRIVLQIHDAVLFEVPERHVAELCEVVIPKCMTEMVPIYPNNITGEPWPAGQPGPYYLSTDTDLYTYWGVPLPSQELCAL
jgi:uracil-DNA glycosylase family 4